MQAQPHLINDLKNYRIMSEPFSSAKEADDALNAFVEGVRELRQKHRIADVLTVVQVNILHVDGSEGQSLAMSHNGMFMNTEPMAAFAFGEAQANRKESISKLLANRGTAR